MGDFILRIPAAVLSGLLMGCALSGHLVFRVGWLAWVALVPLFWALRRTGAGRACLLGALVGAVQAKWRSAIRA